MAERPRLRALAARLGIEDGYHSALDRAFVATTDATREALAAAMGFEAASEAAAERALASLPEPAPEADDPRLPRCFDAGERVGTRGAFGIWCNLYSVRSADDWGFGHLGALEGLVRLAGERGAEFVGTSPLHATTNRPGAFCPYTPVSRFFRDPLYLDPGAVPGFAADADARRAREALRRAPRLDPAATEALLLAALRPLHAACLRDAGGDDRDAFERFRRENGAALEHFATFQALADRFEGEGRGRDWRGWPAAFRDCASREVRAFREGAGAEAVSFHAWLQFQLDRQLEGVARAAREAGLSLGLYGDLALGSAAGGSDTWARPDLFAHGATLGAPPDGFAVAGQDWSLPPVSPLALRADGLRWWRSLLDASFRHCGALRIDHALGLRRLFWIPEGRPPGEGAYVRQPESALLAELARASHRHRACVIAEDLGTVPEGFRERIGEAGLLGSRVLLFERDARGFAPASAWPERCLATANTHDLPPLAALAGDEDLRLRRRVGQIPDDATLERLCAERRDERRALRERLSADGLLAPEASGDDALAAAVTAFLCATPAVLVGVSLDDLAGETEPINLSGVSAQHHPSWTRRMSAALAAVFEAPRAGAMLGAVPPHRRAPSPQRRRLS